MKKTWIPTILLLIIFISLALLVPKLTSVTPYNSNDKQIETTDKNSLQPDRHYEQIRRDSFIKSISVLNTKGTVKPFFKIKKWKKDSILIQQSVKTTAHKERFEKVFFNKKTVAKMATYKDSPIRLIQNKNGVGFIIPFIKEDSTDFLVLPYDVIIGVFKEKGGIGI